MSIDAMKQALETLEECTAYTSSESWSPSMTRECEAAITALRERLAQPDAYGYASRLAVAIWEQHYRDAAPQWKPLDDLLGVLTQIDNMTSGLTRLAQPEQEPVAWVYPEGVEALNAGKPWTAYGTRQEPNNIALYLSPQPSKQS